MLLAYVDESYRDINDKFLMGAVICDEQGAAALTKDLNEIVSAFTLNRGMSHHTELHAQQIWQGTKDWAQLRGEYALQTQMLNDCIDAIVAHASHLVWRAVNVVAHRSAGYVDTWPPDVVCFQHLLERVEQYAARVDKLALVIRDEVDNPNAPRKMLRSYREEGTPGWRATPLPHIIDTIHFAPSDHSRLLQAADIFAFVMQSALNYRSVHALSQPVVSDLKRKVTSSGKNWGDGMWP